MTIARKAWYFTKDAHGEAYRLVTRVSIVFGTPCICANINRRLYRRNVRTKTVRTVGLNLICFVYRRGVKLKRPRNPLPRVFRHAHGRIFNWKHKSSSTNRLDVPRRRVSRRNNCEIALSIPPPLPTPYGLVSPPGSVYNLFQIFNFLAFFRCIFKCFL